MAKKNECPNELELLKVELEQVRKQSEDNLNLAKYHKAEFENFKRRNQESVSVSYRDGKEVMVVQFLPILDSLYEGLKTVETPNDKEGLEVLVRKFNQILSAQGVEQIEALGKPFDPNFHNAVAVEDVKGKESDIVIEEWQKGFTLGGRVIRPSTVKVSK